jgi:hypothetical protein
MAARKRKKRKRMKTSSGKRELGRGGPRERET